MPAVSKKQQKFMGIVRSIQKGEQPASKFSKDAQDVAKDMKKKDVKKFASTKHKGLPMKKEQMINRLKEMIKQELSEYTYGVGDIVKDVNPSCLHYGAIGKVKEVNPEYVTFVVTNNGDNFSKGQTLEKSHDQMKKVNEGSMDWEKKHFPWANKEEQMMIAKLVFSNKDGIDGEVKRQKKNPSSYKDHIKRMVKKGLHESVNESTARTDKSIGTKNYKGVGWFWPNDGWKHYLRDVENAGRKEVHDLWLKAGFEVKKDNRGIPHFDIKPNERSKAMDIVNKLDRSKKYKHANESVNENTLYKVGDTISLLSFDRKHIGKAKVKSVAKSKPNKFGIKNHYVTDKGTFSDMEVVGTDAYKLRFKGDTEKKVMKAMNLESVNEVTFTPIDKIKDIKNLVKKDLVTYRGGKGGGYEIAIRNRKVPGWPIPRDLYFTKDGRVNTSPEAQKTISDTRRKQYAIKPIAVYNIHSNDLRKLRQFGDVVGLAPNRRESVNEANPTDTIATIDMVNALLKIKSPMSRQTLDALKMMVRHYGLDNIKKEVQRDARKFYKSLQKMEKGLNQDIELESIIKEDYFVRGGEEFSKNFLTGLDLVISQANNLKGQLSKHPVKRDVNKLRAIQTIYKKFLQPSIDKQTDRFKSVDLTKVKKYLQDGKFRNALEYEILSALSTSSYNSNSYRFLDDKQQELVKKLSSSLKDLTNKLDKAQLESVNEASVSQVRSTISRVKKQLMQKWAKKGGYENFGQKELRDLRDKFKENPYGSPEERKISDMLSAFDNWAMNYSGDMRETVIKEAGGVEKILDMARNNSYGKLAGQTVDGLTANLFKAVYDRAPQDAKDKVNKMNERELIRFMGNLWNKFGKHVTLRSS